MALCSGLRVCAHCPLAARSITIVTRGLDIGRWHRRSSQLQSLQPPAAPLGASALRAARRAARGAGALPSAAGALVTSGALETRRGCCVTGCRAEDMSSCSAWSSAHAGCCCCCCGHGCSCRYSGRLRPSFFMRSRRMNCAKSWSRSSRVGARTSSIVAKSYRAAARFAAWANRASPLAF